MAAERHGDVVLVFHVRCVLTVCLVGPRFEGHAMRAAIMYCMKLRVGLVCTSGYALCGMGLEAVGAKLGDGVGVAALRKIEGCCLAHVERRVMEN